MPPNYFPGMQPSPTVQHPAQAQHPRVRRFAVLDALVVVLLVACAIAVVPLMGSQRPEMLVVYVGNRVAARYPLPGDRRFTIKGTQGNVVVEVHDGAVSVVSSSCRRQICVSTPPIRQPGQQIVCVPNRVVVEITAPKRTGAPDAVVR
jgi:hypothetical protein